MVRALSPMLLAAALVGCAPPPYSAPKETGTGDDTGAPLDSDDTGNPDDSGDSGHTGETADTAPPAPTIRIIFPESSNTAFYCSTFMVAVDVDNLVMDEAHFGGDDVAGEGHWHLYSDGAYIGAGSAEYLFIPDAKALSEGEHQLDARLAENDHDEFSPVISDQVEIYVDDTPDDPGTEEIETCLGATGPSTDMDHDTGMGGY